MLRGTSRIGRDAVIRSGSQVFDCVIGERTIVWASILESSVVEDDVTIGPFAHVRAGAHIGAAVQLGNFAEVKNSRLGRGTKSHHFSYLGDAEVGERVNIGAGTITANYDGRQKHRTVIGDGAFIGSDTILRAPVEVGKDASTGAGAVITRDVPPGTIAVGVPARIRQKRTPPQPGRAAAPGGASAGPTTPRPPGAQPAAPGEDVPGR
jgi:bifunctional UDP-N-acetylglucosamine pyrophosphorylase/glucosamine-1-phosphate N-acetyltransferase